MMHDTTLNRTTTGSGRIRDHKWYGDMDQLHMKASPHSPITRLKDVIELILQPSSKDIYMIIDIKYDNSIQILDTLKNLLESYQHHPNLSRRFIIAMWNMEFLKRTKELLPDYQVCFIGLSLSAGARFLESVDCFNLPFAALADREGREFINKVHERKKRVFAWTINNTHQMKTCVLRELDGVLGDHVTVLLEHVQHQPRALTSTEEYQSFVASDTYLHSKRTKIYFYLLKKAMALASSVVIGL
ncbi:unnamed protein product [Rhizopus stolonifer]